jgi:hyperosmotically inducible periplasmic protein
MLNAHLNAFSIDTDVENGKVHLTGAVESDIDRDLAGEIVKGTDGVVDVQNDLKIETSARQAVASKANGDGKRGFGERLSELRRSEAACGRNCPQYGGC